MTDQQFLTTANAVLYLSKKVNIAMAAIDDLRAAEARLAPVVDHAIKTVAELSAQINAVPAYDAEVAAVAARLDNLREFLANHVGEPVAPVAEVVAPVEPAPVVLDPAVEAPVQVYPAAPAE